MPAHDDERVTAVELGVDRRERDRLERELRLLLDVLERVGGEPLQLGADRRRARPPSPLRSRPRRAPVPATEQLAVAPDLAGLDAQDVTLLHEVHELGPDVVDQRDARLHDADRAAVRVPARDRLRAVDHRDDALLDEAVGGDAVEVAVVDHRDVARLQARDHVLRALVGMGRALDGEGRVGLLAQAGMRAISDDPDGSCSARSVDPVDRARSRWRSPAARPRGRARGTSHRAPASMRDSSATRSSPSTTVACATVRSRRPVGSTRSTAFSTTTCVPANAAT